MKRLNICNLFYIEVNSQNSHKNSKVMTKIFLRKLRERLYKNLASRNNQYNIYIICHIRKNNFKTLIRQKSDIKLKKLHVLIGPGKMLLFIVLPELK